MTTHPRRGAEPADVIILPGESLAKYRQSAGRRSGPEHLRDCRHGRNHRLPPEPKATLRSKKPSKQEAEELELAEKIFSHHDDETPEEVEEKIEEVKQDQPIPEPEVEAQRHRCRDANTSMDWRPLSVEPLTVEERRRLGARDQPESDCRGRRH